MEAQNEGFFKKLFYTGLGLALTTKESIDKTIEDLVQNNKITVEEGKKIVGNIADKFEKNKQEVEKEINEFISKTSENLKFAKKKDIENINQRLDEIESKIEKLGTI